MWIGCFNNFFFKFKKRLFIDQLYTFSTVLGRVWWESMEAVFFVLGVNLVEATRKNKGAGECLSKDK